MTGLRGAGLAVLIAAIGILIYAVYLSSRGGNSMSLIAIGCALIAVGVVASAPGRKKDDGDAG